MLGADMRSDAVTPILGAGAGAAVAVGVWYAFRASEEPSWPPPSDAITVDDASVAVADFGQEFFIHRYDPVPDECPDLCQYRFKPFRNSQVHLLSPYRAVPVAAGCILTASQNTVAAFRMIG